MFSLNTVFVNWNQDANPHPSLRRTGQWLWPVTQFQLTILLPKYLTDPDKDVKNSSFREGIAKSLFFKYSDLMLVCSKVLQFGDILPVWCSLHWKKQRCPWAYGQISQGFVPNKLTDLLKVATDCIRSFRSQNAHLWWEHWEKNFSCNDAAVFNHRACYTRPFPFRWLIIWLSIVVRIILGN